MQCAELSRKELDLVVLGQISSLLSNNTSTKSHRPTTSRQRSSMAFYHRGVRVCRKTFQKLHGIGTFLSTPLKLISTHKITHTGKDRFMALKASFLASGLTTRVHGNTAHAPKNALKFDEIKNLVSFINNYAEKHAILLPGRIPGYKSDRIQLLPSSTTKKVSRYMHVGTV